MPLTGPPRREHHGLASAEVADRIDRGQVNRERRSAWSDYRDIVARNLFTLFNALVVPAAVALALLGEHRGAIAVSGMAVVNLTLALVQEVRAKRHLDRLALLAEARARVLRDGTARELPAGEVVLDDLVLLAAGDTVVADGQLLEADYLEVDESLLTGESDPLPRRAGDRLLSGSTCLAGRGLYRVQRVGGESHAQRTAAEARQYQHAASPLQQDIDRLIRLLTATAIALCVFYLVLFRLRGFPVTSLVQMVAATVTSLVPQGLVLMTTLAFTLAAVRMSRRGALVQRLSAVEAMASIDVLCVDKTGTLTTNRLRLDRLVTFGAEDEARRLLRQFAWLSVDERNRSIAAIRVGLGPLPAMPAAEAVDQVPFKSDNRCSVVRVRGGGEDRTLVLGACEALRPRLADGGEPNWEAAWRALLPTGLRLLLFAEAVGFQGQASVSDVPPFEGKLPEMTLRPVALVALSDELRAEAPAVLEALAAQGVRVKIISGDHPETVRATATGLGLALAREPVTSGEELAADPGLIHERAVFGRTSPRQKVEIVAALRATGHHVAMLGDGVNDLLPIKRADLGIAMGSGSPATRTVAGLVLEGNDFRLLPAARDEGSAVVRNLRRAARLFLLKNVYTLFLIVAALGVLDLPFPYLPQQVTLLNALTIGVPALLIVGLGGPGQPSRDGFLTDVGRFALFTGLAVGAAGLAVLLLSARAFGDDERTQRTVLLSALVLLGLATLFRLGPGGAFGASADRLLRGWAVLALFVYAAALYWPPSADFFQLTPLTPARWALVVGVAGAAFAVCLLGDHLGREEKAQPPARG